ncbi:hypothetical protein DSO57_1012889 [Entomophthora muscae]|uniref:Uncharacterized protein n=1 Tax=Entomophthora muscae TaxID=34485 RepID=A0ACC2TTN2_9FUNG|nr:hypothetical protein DSO57_1012889 [Entomophthora muscae]
MLEIPNYRLLHTIHGLYFSSTDNLIHEYMMVFKTSDASRLTERSPTVYKADIILRLIRLKGEEHGLHFVENQLAMRSKALAWNRLKKKSPKPKSVTPVHRITAYLRL